MSDAPNNCIIFEPEPNREVMRISATGITVPEGIEVDEASKAVINALQGHVKYLVDQERERLAKMLESEQWMAAATLVRHK